MKRMAEKKIGAQRVASVVVRSVSRKLERLLDVLDSVEKKIPETVGRNKILIAVSGKKMEGNDDLDETNIFVIVEGDED